MRVGFTSEKEPSGDFDSTCGGGGNGSTEACGGECDEMEVLSALHDTSWPIYAFNNGPWVDTAEPKPDAKRRDGNASDDVETHRSTPRGGRTASVTRPAGTINKFGSCCVRNNCGFTEG